MANPQASVPHVAGHAVPMTPQGVPVVAFNPSQQNFIARPVEKVEYSEKNISTVRGLTVTQLVLGIIIFIFHVATTAMNDDFNNVLSSIRHEFRYFFWDEFVDHAATGIWVGILIIIGAAIGIGGYMNQKKGLIITHLVLNVFILMALIALTTTLCINMIYLTNCRKYGESYSRPDRYYNNYNHHYDYYNQYEAATTTTTTTTTTPQPYIFFGEKLEGYRGEFYCKNTMFRAWLALDSIMLVCAVVLFFLTLTLMIYNSKAACLCCRKTGCCGNCCSCCYPSSPSNYSVPVVAYYAQSNTRVALAPNMQMAAQPHGTSNPYPQPITVYRQPAGYQPMLPTAVPYQQPVLTAVTTNPAQPVNVHMGQTANVQVPQPAVNLPAAAANSDEKWEELPPEYAEVFRNEQRH